MDNVHFFLVDAACSCQWVTIIFIYLPPKLTLEALRKTDLDYSAPVLLAGDTNFNSQSSSGLIEFILEEFGLRYLETSCTTDYGTTLDQVFTNIAIDEI